MYTITKPRSTESLRYESSLCAYLTALSSLRYFLSCALETGGVGGVDCTLGCRSLPSLTKESTESAKSVISWQIIGGNFRAL